MDILKLRRVGEGVIKYKLNTYNTKHLFCYYYEGLYYKFIMYKGVLVDINNKEIKDMNIRGSKSKGKHFNTYLRSSLNLYFTEDTYSKHK